MTRNLEATTMRRVFLRLVPLLFAAMFLNYLDRFNIGFAALRMNHDLHFTPAIFGFGASLFFFGYMLLGVPSNLMLHRVGARKWVGAILVTWGAVATCTAFIWNPASFYGVRIMLGMVEAGFLPGVAFYVTLWFPAKYRARAVGGYIVAGQFSAVVGAPLSALIMSTLQGTLGLHSWQWMFIIEGAPTILLGFLFWAMLTERPAKAGWLTAEQRAWLQNTLAAERAAQEQGGKAKLADMLADGRVWRLAVLFGCALVGIYGMLIWLPQIVNQLGHHLSLIDVGLLSAVPPMLGVIGTLIISYSSDRTGDRKLHLAGLYLVGAVALAGSALAPSPVLAYALLCVVGLCINSGNSLFWSLSASLMTGVAGAGAIAFVNTIAQFGGLIGPWMIGFVRGRTGSFALGLITMAVFLMVAGLIALTLRVAPARRVASSPSEALSNTGNNA
jgi:MFS family permease